MPRLRPFAWVYIGFARGLESLAVSLHQHSERTLIGISLTLILAVSTLYFTLLWPMLDARHGRIMQILEGGFSLLLLINVLCNYGLCIVTPPGSTCNIVEGYHLAAPEAVRFCRTCRKAKPPLSHHCSVCKQCVLRMDHHCYLLNNCIGLGNYAHFLRFCLFLFLGSAYGAAVLLQHLRSVSGHDADWQPHRSKFIVAFVLCFGTCVGLAALSAWHIYLLSVGETTYEMLHKAHHLSHGNKAAKKKDVGRGFAANIKEACGLEARCWWLLCLLPTSQADSGGSGTREEGFLFRHMASDL